MHEYKEKYLESFIESYLLKSGYIKRASKDYDKNLCIDIELLKRFISQIGEKGILKALKSPIEIRDVKIKLA